MEFTTFDSIKIGLASPEQIQKWSYGKVERPDRVILRGRTATIVDYKFGVELDVYRHQLKRYTRLYRDLGYEVAGSFIWYVEEDKVVPV